jgi:hypothetical protein
VGYITFIMTMLNTVSLQSRGMDICPLDDELYSDATQTTGIYEHSVVKRILTFMTKAPV